MEAKEKKKKERHELAGEAKEETGRSGFLRDGLTKPRSQPFAECRCTDETRFTVPGSQLCSSFARPSRGGRQSSRRASVPVNEVPLSCQCGSLSISL